MNEEHQDMVWIVRDVKNILRGSMTHRWVHKRVHLHISSHKMSCSERLSQNHLGSCTTTSSGIIGSSSTFNFLVVQVESLEALCVESGIIICKGHVSARSCSIRFWPFNVWIYFQNLFVSFVRNRNPVKKWHTGRHTSFSNVGQPNQTLWLASSQLAAATMWDGSHLVSVEAGTWGELECYMLLEYLMNFCPFQT